MQRWGLVKFFLSFSPLVSIGRMSYSVYLWHWPIIVYYRTYVNEREFSIFETLALIATTIFAAYLSWKFIEERYRYIDHSPKKIFRYAFCSILVTSIFPASVYLFEGFPHRISTHESAITDRKLMWKWQCTDRIKMFPELDENFCVIGDQWETSQIKGIVWGDSHSQHWAPILHQEAKNIGASLVIAPRECPSYLNSEIVKSHYPKFPNFTKRCTDRNNLTLNWINRNDIQIIIMASAWSGHIRMLYTDDETTNKSDSELFEKSAEVGAKLCENALKILITKLKNKKVLLIADVPRPNKVLNECAIAEVSNLLRKKCDVSLYRSLDLKMISEWHYNSDWVLRNIANDFSNVDVIFPRNSLCNESECQTYINGELIYKDNNHLRRNLKKETITILSDQIGIHTYFQSLLSS